MKMYFAAAWGQNEYMRVLRRLLASYGHTVNSRWINMPPEDGVKPGEMLPDVGHHGTTDLEDIDDADMVVVFTDKPSSTGGYFVEFGYALAKGKRVLIVGPVLNIFMIPCGRYATIEDFLDAAPALV